MRWICLCLGLVLLWPTTAAAQSRFAPPDAALLQAGLTETADGFILPAYAAQADATADLAAALSAYCAGSGDLAAAQSGFADAFLAWQRASLIAVGPILDDEGPMRVQLWPDPKGFAGRAIRAAVAAEDPALIADGGLEGRSIALTNLTALEGLLYGDLAPGTYACALAQAIAVFQADLARGLETAWTPGSAFRADFDSAHPGNARFASVDTVIRQVLAGAVVHADRLRKFKLLRGMGDAPGEARPERTEARRSGLGLASIRESFRALADFYDTPFGLFDVAPDLGGSMDYFVLAQTASAVADTLSVMPDALDSIAAEDGAAAAELRRMADTVLYHEDFLKTGFTNAIGLTAGFTAADGD